MLWHLQTMYSLTGAWGLKSSLPIFIKRQTTKTDRQIRKISIPGLQGQVFLRPRSSDWSVLHQVFLAKEYEIPSKVHRDALDRHYRSIVAAGDVPVIVDCGANIGFSALWYHETYPQAVIVAIEPEPGNHALLALNARGRDRILPVQAGVLDRATTVSLHNDGSGDWAWETRETAGGDVTTLTIEQAVAMVARGRQFIVKIDIEGSEVELFRSNTSWTKATPLIVFESHDMGFAWRGTAHTIYSALVEQPRDYLGHGENVFAFSHELLR